jgi:hypothetical protein
MQLAPLICVRDVESSSRWYQRLLGCESGHGGSEYERLNSDGRLILQLHNWEVEHQHGRLHGGRWYQYLADTFDVPVSQLPVVLSYVRKSGRTFLYEKRYVSLQACRGTETRRAHSARVR